MSEVKYPHLLSPLKIGNIVLKNRMMQSKSLPHFIQGPENFPAEPTIRYYANIARNGAAIVTCKGSDTTTSRDQIESKDGRHMAIYDVDDFGAQNYFSQLTDAIHYYGSKASISLHRMEPEDCNISEITEELVASWKGDYRLFPAREMTIKDIEAMIEDMSDRCVKYQKLGFDMCNLYMTYRSSILSCALSPAVNKRTDKYGGSLENRARLPLELCEAIKRKCGRDFLIEAQISGYEEEGGFTLEDTVAFAKLAEGKIDILHIRGFDGSEAHPTGFNSASGQYATLRVAEAIKNSGARIVVAPNGGYQSLEDNERILAEGKADMITMARAFICDYDYLKKAVEGRGEDVVPCVRCNKCHVPSLDGPWMSICSVNPLVGINHLKDVLVPMPEESLTVAVVGGGPAGMAAALYSTQRGHKVTLYEKTGKLGGQLLHADFASFKWPLMDYKDYLVQQIAKNGVDIQLNTPATKALLASGGFDAVIAATGAVPKRPDIPGAFGKDVWAPIEVFGHEHELGKRVVVVGGSETGVETAMYLAENGHEVTVLTRQNKLAPDATPIHFYEMFEAAWEQLENFSFLLEASATEIGESSVTYRLSDGTLGTMPYDSVVLCGGVRPLQDEALEFAPLTPRFFMIGDARKPGNIHECSRTAFAAANQL